MKPVKPKPQISNPSNHRTPNTASPVGSPTIGGNFTNNDKDYSKWSQSSPQEINKLHSRDDVDVSAFSHHHTLGTRHFQASPGDHLHDGSTSKLIGDGMGLIVTGSKGSNAALTSLIAYLKNFFDITDTTT